MHLHLYLRLRSPSSRQEKTWNPNGAADWIISTEEEVVEMDEVFDIVRVGQNYAQSS